MKRRAKITCLGFAIVNSFYTDYAGVNSDVCIIDVFLLLLGWLFSMAIDEKDKEAKTFLLFIIVFGSVSFTAIVAVLLKSAVFVFVAAFSFVSGFFARVLDKD